MPSCVLHCSGQLYPLRKGSSWDNASTCRRAVRACRLLAVDSRNFLAWAYRRFVVERACVPLEDEERYSMDCINANFSNYSAWHARTVLLPHIHAAQPTTSLTDLLAADSAPKQAAAPGEHRGKNTSALSGHAFVHGPYSSACAWLAQSL